MMERPPIFTTCSQGRSRIGRTAGDGAGEVAVEQGLARERRGDVLDGVGGFGHGVVL